MGSAGNRGPGGSVGKRDGDWAVEEEASPVWKLPWPSPAAGTSLGKFFPFHFHLSPSRYRRALSGLPVPDSRVSGLDRPPAAPLSSEPPREVEAGRRRPNPPAPPSAEPGSPSGSHPQPRGEGRGPGEGGAARKQVELAGAPPLAGDLAFGSQPEARDPGLPEGFRPRGSGGSRGPPPWFPQLFPGLSRRAPQPPPRAEPCLSASSLSFPGERSDFIPL